jgi:hypothetical protein
MMLVGAYVGMAMLIVYAGRWFYLSVCMRSVGLRANSEVDVVSIWAFRSMLVCTGVFAAVLMWMGVPWDITMLWLLGLLVFLTCCPPANMFCWILPMLEIEPLSTGTSDGFRAPGLACQP